MIPDQVIRKKFRVKQRDTLPFTGYLESTRLHLAEVFNELGYKVGAEIGVDRGKNAKVLFENIKDLKLYCVDPWIAYNKSSQERVDRNFRWCKNRLKNYNAIFVRKKSIEAAKDIPDNSLDFVYIDGLHEFDPVMLDLIYWSRKVRLGGIISGHDYYNFYRGGIIQAVNAYTHAHDISEWYITTGEPHPSFFWVQKRKPRHYQQGI